MIKVILPVYYTQEFRTKRDKTFLVGMNWFRNSFYHQQNSVKKYFSDLIKSQLVGVKSIDGQYTVIYTYYYKSSVSDLGNVCSMASKFFLDALQESKLVINDNVQYCIKEEYLVGGEDKSNPRIEITLTPV